MSRLKLMPLMILLAVLPSVAFSQSIKSLWKKAEVAQKEGKPQTVIEITENILDKAVTSGKTDEAIKAFMWYFKNRKAISTDSVAVDIARLEKWVANTTDLADKALMHSFLAELLFKNEECLVANVYGDEDNEFDDDNNVVSENKEGVNTDNTVRTEYVSEPKKANRWDRKAFSEKVLYHINASLENTELLAKTKNSRYKTIVKKGWYSECYGNDLLNLIMTRATALVEEAFYFYGKDFSEKYVDGIYDKVISTYQSLGNEEAAVATMITKAYKLKIDGEKKFKALKEIVDKYGKYDCCGYAMLRMSEFKRMDNEYNEAFSICNEALSRYKRKELVERLNGEKQELLRTQVNLELSKEFYYPDDTLYVNASYRNVKTLVAILYKDSSVVSRYSFDIPKDLGVAFNKQEFFIKLPNEVGSYSLDFEVNGRIVEEKKMNFAVTRLLSTHTVGKDNNLHLFVFDSKHGNPVEGAKIRILSFEGHEVKAVLTDKVGYATLPKTEQMFKYQVELADDNSKYSHVYRLFSYNLKPYNRLSGKVVDLITDRLFYRPGQEVYLKGIATYTENNVTKVMPNEEFELEVWDDYYEKQIYKHKVKTNEFGSFNAKIALPKEMLNGYYKITLKGEEASKSIRVENYKLPTFEVKFDAIEGQFSANQDVEIKGKAVLYNGVALSNTKVRYEVRKSSYGRGYRTQDKLIYSGNTTTNNEGKFTIATKLITDKEEQGNYLVFEVKAIVTDASGETVSKEKRVFVGTSPLLSQVSITKKNITDKVFFWDRKRKDYSAKYSRKNIVFAEEILDKEQPLEVYVSARNYDGIEMEATVEYRIIKQSDWIKEKDDKVVLSGEFEANKKVNLDLSSLDCDKYVILTKAKTKFNQYSEESLEGFMLFSEKENKSVVDRVIILYAEDDKVGSDGKAKIKIGTSADEIKTLITVFDNKGELRHKEYITVKRGIYTLELADLHSYGESAYVSVMTVKESTLYEGGLRFNNGLSKKTLRAKWVVFRDKLSPNIKETWKMVITDSEGNLVPAEVLATMHDASLNSLGNLYERTLFGKVDTNFKYKPSWDAVHTSEPKWNYMSEVYVSPYGFANLYDNLTYGKIYDDMFSYVLSIPYNAEEVVVTGYASQKRLHTVGAIKTRGANDKDEKSEIRKELVETAFFFPELRTNSKGEVEFSFNSPQALTRWNFNAYVHTKDYDTFVLRDTVRTVKELMLMVNKPRFVRVGDEGRLSAKLVNNSNERVDATVKLELISAETNKVLHTERRSVKVESRDNVEAEFTMNIKDMPNGALKCRVVADSKKFSDGEEFYLPVVSNREMITNALTFLGEAGQTTKENIGNLFIKDWKYHDNKSITVEVVSNPIWYAIMSIPTLQSTSDNALSMAAMLWGNGLTEGIVNQRPEVRDVFNTWITSGRKTNNGKSQLYMNGELKDILLENTPWLFEAQDEYTQRMNVAKAFDEAQIQIDKNYAIEKLLALQANDGSYSWFGKRGGSKSVTALVLYCIDNYMDATDDVNNSPLRLVRNNIIQYLSNEMISWNDKYVKDKAKMTNAYLPSYLIMSSISLSRGGTELVAGLKEANNNFMKAIAENVGKLSLEDRALYSIALNKQGKHKEAKNVLESIKQHLVQKKGLGAYFDSNLVRETKMISHLHAMTALSLYEENKPVVAKMRQWLISNKRANKWGEDLNTAFAVAAIVNSVDKSSSLLSSDLEVTAGKHTIVSKQDDKNTQLGYIKKRIELSEMKDWVNDITIINKGTNEAIVNVYSQYEAPLLEVETFSFASKIRRKAYVEKVDGDKRVNKLITPNTILEVGDKVVTYLTILSDRDLSFVRVKEQRASNLEPVDKISAYKYSDGLWYYQELKDTHYNMFIDNLSKGEYVIKQEYRVTTRGKYQMGLVRLESVYAPEFVSHSKSFVINATR